MRQGRFISTAVAALAALAIAPTAAWAAPGSFVDDTAADFGAGTAPATETVVAPAGSVELARVMKTEHFEGTALPAAYTAKLWDTGPMPAGSWSVNSSALAVDGARVASTRSYAAGQDLEFRATFGAANFQHVGLGNTVDDVGVTSTFNDGPWAIFSTGNTATPGSTLFARTLTGPATGGGVTTETDVKAKIPTFDPTTPHDYLIVWSASQVKYIVDGTEVASHEIAVPISGQLRPAISDANAGGAELAVDSLGLSLHVDSGTFQSRIHDAGDPRGVWGKLTGATTPAVGTVTFATRSGNTATPDANWSAYQDVSASADIQSPPARYIQYRATLITTDDRVTPSVDSVELGYDIDSTAPITTIGGTGTTVTFSSPDTDVARFECSVDGGVFTTCASPTDYSGLAPGSHTVSVQAVDKAGNVGPAVSRTVSIAGGGIPTPPDDDDTALDTTAPDVTIGSRKLRASASGKVKLRLTCPDDEDSCEIRVRLKRNGKTLAAKILTLAGGESTKVTLKLSKKARRKLAARGHLKAKVVITASDEAGNEDRTKYSVTLRPR